MRQRVDLQGFANVRFPLRFAEKPQKDWSTIIPADFGPEAVDLISR